MMYTFKTYWLAGFVVMLFASLPAKAEAAIFNTAAALEQSAIFALDPVFDPVGLLVGTNSVGANFVAGTGVLIDPYWVLTAGHVNFASFANPWDEMRFFPSPDVLNNQDYVFHADAWFAYPGHDRTVPAGKGNDIGLVRLVDPIFDIAPAIRFYGEDVEGTEMIMAGYGNPGVWPNEGDFDGIRRAGQNIGDSFGFSLGANSAEEQFWVARFSQFTSENPFPVEWQLSKNDSGGGWFAEIDGMMQLVGIGSFWAGNHDLSGATRVSLYNDWIDATMAAHPAPSVPEPSSLLLMSLGILSIGLRRCLKKAA